MDGTVKEDNLSCVPTELEELRPTSSSLPLHDQPKTTPPDPDGGLRAWLQVLCSWMLFFNTFGLANTFGIYQKYYERADLFKASPSDISWIGSLQAALILLVGALTGPTFDSGHLRILLVTGLFGVVAGHMILSLCHEYWQVLISQGIIMGLGAGCLHVPSLAVLPGYFPKRLGLAVGIAVFGSSVGGIIYPITFELMINRIGFQRSVRTLGFIAAALLIFPVLLMRTKTRPVRKRSLIDHSVFKDAPFIIFVIACVIGYCGLYVCVFYLALYGESSGIMTSRMASYLVPIFNASSVPGRLIPGYFADKSGPLSLMGPCSLISGILAICFVPVQSSAGLLALTILAGIFSGTYFSLPSVVVSSLTKDKTRIGTRIGMLYFCVAFGVLAGGPGAGGILGPHPTHRQWTGVWVYSGICILASGGILLYLWARVLTLRRQ